ncbi:urease subunit gamma [Halosimplex aquaticum]|uniref:Urease subunit gamma n=1 Tax=Halosimplex aquaticum TaxID=3026162 RepID=A0ABD5Y8C6_9EURY|nr:urease subunit gamma [Halosimplex aquaticum]
MNVTPKEEERLTVFMAAELARRRRERGVRLNHPEAVAYISDWCVERARDGWDVADIRAEATQLLDPEDVMPGVPEMVDMIQVEPVFPDGTKLVTVHDPIRSTDAADSSSDSPEEADS